jgi:hypothetical protein
VNKFKEWWRTFQPAAREVARRQHDNYISGDIPRNFLFMFEVVIVSLFLTSAAIIGATVTFSPDGWAGVIGQVFARECIGQGICDLDVLLAGLAIGTIIIVTLIILVAMVFEKGRLIMDAPNDDLYQAVNDIADDTLGLREQNQTLMAMVFMLAGPELREPMADMFRDTLDDEESKQLRTLLEEAEAERELLPEPPATEEWPHAH